MVFPTSEAFPIGSPAPFSLMPEQASADKTIVCLTEPPTPQADTLNGEQNEADPRTHHANEKGNVRWIG